MNRAGSLDALERLDRDHLHVFVAGPGLGEGVAVALPESGWLLVDGCTTGTDGRGLPLEAIVTRFRASADEPVVAMVLTHPHEDHVGGFAELIDALRPRVIGLLAWESPRRGALRALRSRPASTTDRLRQGSVLRALSAVDRWAEEHPGKLLALCDGVPVPVAPSPAKVIARAPHEDEVVVFVTTEKLQGGYCRDTNRISIVLEVEHGAARLVLGSDLPRTAWGGWDRTMADHPHLGAHAVLKIPHHGSAEAMHPGLMPVRSAEQRAWAVTPYNRSRLPRVAELDGLPSLLEREPSILLTAMPASKRVQARVPQPGTVSLGQLASRMALQPTGTSFLDGAGVEVTPRDDLEPLDPVWCVAVDRTANIVGRWRGRVALEVVPG